MLLLIDGSALLSSQYYGNLPDSYKIAKDNVKKAKTAEEIESANEMLTNSYKDFLQTSTGIYTNGVYGFMKYLFKMIKSQNPEYVAVTWDVTRNTFRRQLSSDYKGTRSETPEPLKQQFKTCQKILSDIGVPQFFSTDYESDDYCGSIVKKFESVTDIKILTKDHDFFQLVSDKTNVYLLCATLKQAADLNSRNGIDGKTIPDKTFLVNNKTIVSEYGFKPESVPLIKALAGDTADNIHGVNGIGEQTAISLANNYSSINDIFAEIEGKSKDELDLLKEKWKTFGIKRSPIKYLESKESFIYPDGTVKSAKEMAELSYNLAKIKTDIEIDITLDDLKYCIDKENAKNILLNYEIKSISI